MAKNRAQIIDKNIALLQQQAVSGRPQLAASGGHGRQADLIDSAQDSLNDDMEAHALESQFRNQQKVDDALALVRVGAYGVCVGCNKAIPSARLEALPTATHCIKCVDQA